MLRHLRFLQDLKKRKLSSMEKERLMPPSALRLQLLLSCQSWYLPSSGEEALFLLHRCVNKFGFVSNTDKGISIIFKTRTEKIAYDSKGSSSSSAKPPDGIFGG
jgi:hypothetical protein